MSRYTRSCNAALSGEARPSNPTAGRVSGGLKIVNGRKDGPNRTFGNCGCPSPKSAKYRCQSGGMEVGSRRYSSYIPSTKARLVGPGKSADLFSIFCVAILLIRLIGDE